MDRKKKLEEFINEEWAGENAQDVHDKADSLSLHVSSDWAEVFDLASPEVKNLGLLEEWSRLRFLKAEHDLR